MTTLFVRIRLWCGVALVFQATLAGADTSRLAGTVRDQQGASVPAAQITLVNESTGLSRQAATSELGEYLFLELPIGTYRLQAEASGFRRFVQSGIQLSVSQSARNDITLTLGELAQEVTVRETARVIDTTTSEVKYTVDSARIKDIPLAGRNVLALAALMPGVVSTGVPAGAGEGTNLFVNGNRSASMDFKLDGGTFSDESYLKNPNRYPPPDAIEEFTILTNAFKAEYGTGVAVVNAASKSGTNQVHGSVWEFIRNNKLNAVNFFGGPATNKYQFNQFGVAVGGPVIRNKTFYFLSYEGFRGRLGASPATSIVPTPAERSGNLSSVARQLTDPLNNQPFAGNIIPASRLDPLAQKVMNTYLPQANFLTNRYVFAFPTRDIYDMGIFRADHSLTDKSRISARGTYTPGPFVYAYANFPGFRRNDERSSSNLVVSHNYVFSPTMLNEFRATAQRVVTLRQFEQDNAVGQREFGFNTNVIPPSNLLPLVGVSGYFTLGIRRQFQKILGGQKFVFEDAHSMVLGRHTIKIGGHYKHGRSGNWGGFNTNGGFSFTGDLTGNALADYLIGRPASYEQRSPTGYSPANHGLTAYIQDDLKVNRRLTLNLGFRYEVETNPKDDFAQYAFYTPQNFATGVRSTQYPTAPPGILFVGDPGMPTTGGLNRWHTIGVLGPRFGFAYDLAGNGKTVVRGAFGISNVPVDLQMLSNSSQSPPFLMVAVLSYPASFADPFQGRVDPFPAWKPKVPYDLTPLYPGAFYPNNLDYRNGYSEQWNLTVEREIRPDLKVSATYVGSHALRLWGDYTFNQAVYLPGTDARGNPLSTVQNTDSRRPWFPFYGAGNLLFSMDASRKANQLQLVVQKRYSRGLTVLAHYTLSNAMAWCDDGNCGAIQDPANNFADYARSATDVHHRAVASWIYDLPKFTANRFQGLLVNGWQLTGALTLQSGFPMNVTTGSDNSRTGVGNDRPNVVGEWKLPDGRSKGEKIDQFFNTKAFAANNIGAFGNLGRNSLTGPGLANIDLGIFKKFDVREKQRIEFRAEGFNAFNRTNLGTPVTRLASGTFGKILSAGNARIVQLGLKYVF